MTKKAVNISVMKYVVMTSAKCVVTFRTQTRIVKYANILNRRTDTWT